MITYTMIVVVIIIMIIVMIIIIDFQVSQFEHL